jgi:hypothetical protein
VGYEREASLQPATFTFHAPGSRDTSPSLAISASNMAAVATAAARYIPPMVDPQLFVNETQLRAPVSIWWISLSGQYHGSQSFPPIWLQQTSPHLKRMTVEPGPIPQWGSRAECAVYRLYLQALRHLCKRIKLLSRTLPTTCANFTCHTTQSHGRESTLSRSKLALFNQCRVIEHKLSTLSHVHFPLMKLKKSNLITKTLTSIPRTTWLTLWICTIQGLERGAD